MQFGHFTLLSFLIFAWICLLILIRTKFEPVNKSRPATIHLDTNDYNHVDDVPRTPKKTEKTTKLRKYHVPRFMLELYEKNKIRDNCSDTPPDIVRSLIPKHTGSFDDTNEVVQELSDNHLLVFDLPTSNEGEEFVGAELKILTMVEIGSNAIVLGVERQLKISVYDDTTRKLYHLQKVSVYHYNNTWLSFNLTQPVIKVLQKKSKSKYLKVVVSISTFLPHYYETANKFKLSLMPIADDFEHDYPVLLLTYASNKAPARNKEENKETRRKRSLEDDYEEETNNVWDNESAKRFQMKKMKRLKNTCRKKPLYVNFAEIDYDLWIVQPPGYEAYQCQGKCFYPVAEHLNPTKHAIVQALLHSVSPGKASRSCCVPTMLDSISILYVDSNGVLTYRYAYKDMVVVECGCR